ncbi:MAG: heavy metal-binding domain-containing protein [Planctomycetia bacterium]|nr:heavy metal-binding domain-containing protein [Planctomycetia bacterium]
MLITTTENIPGASYKIIGIVQGETVKSQGIACDYFAVFKAVPGGPKPILGKELRDYTQFIRETRELVTERMCSRAEKLGADAIVGVRYVTNNIMPDFLEIMVYGTAVKLD